MEIVLHNRAIISLIVPVLRQEEVQTLVHTGWVKEATSFATIEDRKSSIFCRRVVLELANSVHKGHIGSALSVVDLVDVGLEFVRGLASGQTDRDRFVLSKGHAAMALYAALFRRGFIAPKELKSYCSNSSSLATHPRANGLTVDFSTGSLGQGITFAVGAALAARIEGKQRRTICLISDSELNEGSTWESALFASHHSLAPLVVLLDFNHQQALGRTRDIISLEGVSAAWHSIGWHVLTVDGHSRNQIRSAITEAVAIEKPTLVVGNTVSGSGVSFMEGQVDWHYLPMTEEQFSRALEEVQSYEA